MNRRSFFVCAAVFMVVLLVFSFALAEEITVPFEPVPVNWLAMGFADMEGQGVTTAKPVDSSGNLNGDLSVKFNLTDVQWQELLYNSRDLQYIYWPFEINLPAGTKAKAFVETKYGEDADINFIKAMEYEELPPQEDLTPSGAKIGWPVKIANVTQKETKAIITPEIFNTTYLFKLKDGSNAEHFYRIDLQIAHESVASVEVNSAAPANGRLAFNVGQNKLNNVSHEYKDGIVTYYVEEKQDEGAVIKTTVERPDPKAVKVFVNGSPYGAELSESDPTVGLGIAADKDTEARFVYKLQWLDSDGKEVASPDIITIKTLPAYMGMWTDTAWASAEKEWLLEDNGISQHLEYSDGCWTFEVDSNNVDTLDADRYCDPVHLMYVPIPEDAKYFKMTGGNASLYDFGWAENVKNSLDESDPILIDNAEKETSMKLVEINGRRALAAHFGSIFTKSSLKNGNIDVYVVNEDIIGYGTYRIIEWFDESEQQMSFDGKRGHYIYMVKKPYMRASETELTETAPTNTVVEATAMVESCPADWRYNGMRLKCEIPIQEQTDSSVKYQYMNLTLIDANGNKVTLPTGTQLRVFLPYPTGINQGNAWKYDFDVLHYLKEDHSVFKSMKDSLSLEAAGISFHTTSFSPFLLSYEPTSNDSSSGGSGISVTYNGGNSFSTSNSDVPTSVEIDGASVPFSGNGSNFTVNSIPAGAKWITVKWNSTSVTTNFTPDGNVVSAGVEIPKTGDVSILMPVLMLISTAVIICRKNK